MSNKSTIALCIVRIRVTPIKLVVSRILHALFNIFTGFLRQIAVVAAEVLEHRKCVMKAFHVVVLLMSNNWATAELP